MVIIKGQLIKMLISCKCSLLHFSFPGWLKIEFAGSETIVFVFSKIIVFSSFNYVPFGLYIFYVCSIRRMQLTLLSLPKSFYNFFCSPLFVLFDLRYIVCKIYGMDCTFWCTYNFFLVITGAWYVELHWLSLNNGYPAICKSRFDPILNHVKIDPFNLGLDFST